MLRGDCDVWRLQAQVAGEDEGGDQDDDDEHHGGHRAHRLQLRHVVDTHLHTTQRIIFTEHDRCFVYKH